MLLPDDLQSQVRSELAVVELTTVSLPDLLLALGEDAGLAAMQQWLRDALPAGTAVEYDPFHRHFALRPSPQALMGRRRERRPDRAGSAG